MVSGLAGAPLQVIPHSSDVQWGVCARNITSCPRKYTIWSPDTYRPLMRATQSHERVSFSQSVQRYVLQNNYPHYIKLDKITLTEFLIHDIPEKLNG